MWVNSIVLPLRASTEALLHTPAINPSSCNVRLLHGVVMGSYKVRV